MSNRILKWNLIALAALAALCVLAGSVFVKDDTLGPILPWIMFGWASSALAAAQLIIGVLLMVKRRAFAASWLLAGLITAVAGPGLCAATASVVLFL